MPVRLLRVETSSLKGLTAKNESFSEGIIVSRKLAMILKSVRIVPMTALSSIPSAEPMGWFEMVMNGPSWGI